MPDEIKYIQIPLSLVQKEARNSRAMRMFLRKHFHDNKSVESTEKDPENTLLDDLGEEPEKVIPKRKK